MRIGIALFAWLIAATGSAAADKKAVMLSGSSPNLPFSSAVWTGAGSLLHGEGELGTRISNAPGAVFDVQNDAVVEHVGGAGAPAAFDNRGVIRKSAGAGTWRYADQHGCQGEGSPGARLAMRMPRRSGVPLASWIPDGLRLPPRDDALR